MPNLNLNLNDRAWEVLNELANKSGKTKAEVLRSALVLIQTAEEEKEKNRSFAVIDNDSNELIARLINII